MKALYISDLDGTLLNQNAELSEYSVLALNRLIARGISFSIATARTAATVLHIFKKISLNIPIVLMNGVLVFDPHSQKFIKKEVLKRVASEQIINALHELNQSGMMYTMCDETMRTYYEQIDSYELESFINERKKRYNKLFVQTDDFANVQEEIIYFTVIDSKEKIDSVYSKIAGINGVGTAKYHDIYSDNLWYLEVFSDTATKYNAVSFLRDYGQFDKIIGFGDNLNDIPLFNACDECYAVENAKDEVKKVADATILSNEQDAVVKWLEQNYRY